MDELAITFDLLSLQICKIFGQTLRAIVAYSLSANVYHFSSPEAFTNLKFNQPVTREIWCYPKQLPYKVRRARTQIDVS